MSPSPTTKFSLQSPHGGKERSNSSRGAHGMGEVRSRSHLKARLSQVQQLKKSLPFHFTEEKHEQRFFIYLGFTETGSRKTPKPAILPISYNASQKNVTMGKW